ncbi:MAG: tyrosine--tRNA ligase [Candidatus Wallbacteria bacterium HGW-Wallbacteria-1]|jgi:tyrosyl-tRNA synthetase|uniref:Tyrosine--tRNA ligase n=1 Tax=Candidatus Wallbacteria bacterium HGW-Wallbacteria-1 TaxID=2013854 RepID=A0A2N1PLK8_9BACT|nr:MAG: tyrosine--tRNA ligase [Candidatus Wallbacteria bacterium HGW-Wallbacteria-1]
MSKNAIKSDLFAVLQERGFVKQTTDEEAIRSLLCQGAVTCYAGFDPTADSLHVGHLIPLMALIHMYMHGHRSIALLGGGTAMIGDPSGKSEARKMLTEETILANGQSIGNQVRAIIDRAPSIYAIAQGNSTGSLEMANNRDWIRDMNYIDFLRDIGRHFSVNRMLSFETYKMRMETGLSFIEFNYQLLQSYDFLELNRRQGCRLQIGGDDQWGNIVAGIDLTRRVAETEVFGMTFPLLTTSTGQKMGKTEKGALWIDPEKVSPYEYYQYWVNVDDADVQKLLYLMTFLPSAEIAATADLQGRELNWAKDILAFEATSVAHGREKALEAFKGACAAFGGKSIPADLLPSCPIPREGSAVLDLDMVPSTEISAADLGEGLSILDVLVLCGLTKSKGEGRRLIAGGGVHFNGEKVTSDALVANASSFSDGQAEVRVGKKKHHRLVLA